MESRVVVLQVRGEREIMEKSRLLIGQKEEEEAHKQTVQSVQRTWQENVNVLMCSVRVFHVGVRLRSSLPKCRMFETSNMSFPALQGREIYQHWEF
jgi:hypothetical protein